MINTTRKCCQNYNINYTKERILLIIGNIGTRLMDKILKLRDLFLSQPKSRRILITAAVHLDSIILDNPKPRFVTTNLRNKQYLAS